MTLTHPTVPAAQPPPRPAPATARTYQNQVLGGLLHRCAQHDEAALARLYELTSPWIYALVTRLTNSASVADNAMVATYAKVWRQAARHADRPVHPGLDNHHRLRRNTSSLSRLPRKTQRDICAAPVAGGDVGGGGEVGAVAGSATPRPPRQFSIPAARSPSAPASDEVAPWDRTHKPRIKGGQRRDDRCSLIVGASLTRCLLSAVMGFPRNRGGLLFRPRPVGRRSGSRSDWGSAYGRCCAACVVGRPGREGVWTLRTVADTTSPVYWTLQRVVGLLILIGMLLQTHLRWPPPCSTCRVDRRRHDIRGLDRARPQPMIRPKR